MAFYGVSVMNIYENINSSMDRIHSLSDEIKELNEYLDNGYGELIGSEFPHDDVQQKLDDAYQQLLKVHMACGTYLQKQVRGY